jgi:extradiol dioxygenase family protein
MKKSWSVRLKQLWCAIKMHPGAGTKNCAGCGLCCEHCRELERSTHSNLLGKQPTMEEVETAKLQANSKLLRGRTVITMGHHNGLVMVYFDSFTLNLGMTAEDVEWFCEGLREQVELMKNEASEG